MAQVTAAPSNVGLKDIVDYAAMAYIEIRSAFFGCYIKTIARESPVAGGGHKRIVHVADRVREGVRALNLKTMCEALLNIDLQSMVGRIPDGFVQSSARSRKGALERVVIYGVKRKYAELLAKPEIGKGKCALITLTGRGTKSYAGTNCESGIVGVSGNAEGFELSDQCRLRRITVHHAEDSSAFHADVIDFHCQAARDLPLHAEIPIFAVRRFEVRIEQRRENLASGKGVRVDVGDRGRSWHSRWRG